LFFAFGFLDFLFCITIAKGRITKPDKAQIDSTANGLLEHCGKQQLGKISVVSQTLGDMTWR
jgi:hypothetical protein